MSALFRTIHQQFLRRVADRLREGRVKPDNSPAHGLVVSELIFYRETSEIPISLHTETNRER